MGDAFDGFTPEDVFNSIGQDVPLSAIFTTFTFSPATFYDRYLRRLQQIGCERIYVLVDSIGYAQSLTDAAYAEGIGTDYVIRCVLAEGAFHAKLILIETATRTILAVGSGNLTVSGIFANAEV